MDFIDFLIDKSQDYLTGYFYRRRPKSITDGRVSFNYHQADPSNKMFSSVMKNVRADSETYAVTTKAKCGFNVGGYISTQNGKNWLITEVVTNEQEERAGDALRWFSTAKQSESTMRLISVDNLWTEETYSECVITIILKKEARDINIVSGQISVYNDVEPTVTHISSSEAKAYPYIINKNKLTFFVPQGTCAEVKLGFSDEGEMKYQTVKIDKRKTYTDELSYPVEAEV